MSQAGGNHPPTDRNSGAGGATNHVTLLRRLEATLPTIEEAGCAVGSGVVTGADAIFTGAYDDLPVEAEHKLPLIKAQDLAGGGALWVPAAGERWLGMGLVNPFAADSPAGGAAGDPRVGVGAAPRLAAYLDANQRELRARPYARKNPESWWRPIDRIHARLAAAPKLLVPDSKEGAAIAYDAGRFYPHRTVSYITARDWDLQALGAVLCTPILRLFVAAHTTQMRGGALRVPAQALRRVRLPAWGDVPGDLAQALREAAQAGIDQGGSAAARRAVGELYRLTQEEQAIVAALPLEHG